MLQYIKKISFLGTLALTLTLGQASMAMDDQEARESTGAPLSSSSASLTQSMDDLIAQDPIKKFAFQAKNLSEEKTNKCPCFQCSCFAGKSNELWDAVKDADTSSPEVKESMTSYANHDHAFDRLPLDMKTWLTEQGYRTGSDAPSLQADDLEGIFVASLLAAAMMGGNGVIKIYVPKNFFDQDKNSDK